MLEIRLELMLEIRLELMGSLVIWFHDLSIYFFGFPRCVVVVGHEHI